ncbi:MAG: histidine kinase [Ruminococcaceae bacterium]|nr:histidine kinase [Oscillospiraceae bacterium]
MRGKIFRNSFLLSLLTLLVSGTLFCTMLYHEYERRSFDSLSVEAQQLMQSMAYADLSQLRSPDRVTHIGNDGTILYDSTGTTEWATSLETAHPEIAQARANGSGHFARHAENPGQRELHFALQLPDGSLLHLTRSQPSLGRMLLDMLWPFTLTLAVLLALAAWLSLRLARQITGKINSISLSEPHDIYPELQPLVQRLQQQNEIIRRQMDQLRQRIREFDAITENMGEGLLLLDSKGNILSVNTGIRQLLNCENATHLRSFDQIPGLIEAAEQALAGRRGEHLQTLPDRTLQFIANPVLASGQVAGAVVLAMDVTEQQQREALRREFSANVSHELKTPLTAISGFAELIREGLVPQDKVQEFAGDIYRESQRLVDLVEDIIDLSHLDEGGTGFEMEPVDLHQLCQQVLESLQPVAQRSQVQLQLEGDVQTISGAAQILHEMVYNLCDNAIKYNRPGGHVRLWVGQRKGRTILEVSDTGIGIPYAHQSRVFERFYRVDKSHSRAVGGTGLGLSIVKHAAQFHNAQLQLESQPEVGTTITVIF